MKQDLDISNVERKRKRKRIEKSKYDAVMADLAQTSRYADELFQKLEQAVCERAEQQELATMYLSEIQGLVNQVNEVKNDRALAVYVAVVATICALVLSLAVWFGALIPKI